MDFIKAKKKTTEITPDCIKEGAVLDFGCCVHKIKKRSGFTFVTLRTGRYVFLAVHNPKFCDKPLQGVFEGVYLRVKCVVRKEIKAENGLELAITDYSVLSKPIEKYSMPVSDKVLDCAPEEIAENRVLSFRNPLERAPVFVGGTVLESFACTMKKRGFMPVRVPGISSMSFEAEKDIFSLKYFDKHAYLCQDPSIYTQCSMAFFDKVYDVSKVFYGKKRNSPRLLSEYTVMRFEQAYITSQTDLMEMTVSVLKDINKQILTQNQYELNVLEAVVPSNVKIPAITFSEAMNLLDKKEHQSDLDPTDERRLCDMIYKDCKCEFLFVTEYPTAKRTVSYQNNKGIALLFRGMEIAFGGEKIFDYETLKKKNVPSDYLEFFKFGMPPHGGVGIGLERYIMQLLELRDIRQVSLFPRDMHILKL